MNPRESLGVLYLLLNGHAIHSINLIVSVVSLRRHYNGPIAIACDRQSMEVADAIASDSAAGGVVSVVKLAGLVPKATRWECLLTKTLAPSFSPFERTLLLDCDTLIVDRIHRAFPRCDDEVCFTSFHTWRTSNSPRTRKRVSLWSKSAPDLAARMLAGDYPAINTGVMGFGLGAQRFFREWRRLAARHAPNYDDEMAAQLLFPDYRHRVLPWHFNASVAFDGNERLIWGAKIWHGHGHRFLRRKLGQAVWVPTFMQCVEQNVAGIRSRELPSSCRLLPYAIKNRLARMIR